jgi:hypothetical protein
VDAAKNLSTMDLATAAPVLVRAAVRSFTYVDHRLMEPVLDGGQMQQLRRA